MKTLRMLGMEQVNSIMYHEQSNGMVELLNSSLKPMICKLTGYKPSSWNVLLPAVLFAYREVQNASTGYSAFTLRYGRKVRGPAIELLISAMDETILFIFFHQYVQHLEQTIRTNGNTECCP
ncbi:Pol polyprotein [Plakobranchus ocellatus]|uniref:Pol polyprotein n=1 Tax=Plakobranchus ocellatus TaxID=259542 RepID=A0AAV3Y6X7_9GAST|nr:Pol polyprotein [Plakobranchus ocellatus]